MLNNPNLRVNTLRHQQQQHPSAAISSPTYPPPVSPQSPHGRMPAYTNAYAPAAAPGVPGRQPSFRRHTRKRSSTIFVQARQPPPGAASEQRQQAEPALLHGATTLAAAQLLSKLLAFALNQLLIRFLGARDLGAASQLELLLTTSLSLSREALRLASQRQSLASRRVNVHEYTTDGRAVLGTVLGSYQETVNLGWLAAALGSAVLAVSAAAMSVYNTTWPRSALLVTCAAAAVELAVEPCFLLMQLKLEFARRARAESAANAARVLTVALFLLLLKQTPFLSFALGHLAYALTLAALYLRPTARSANEQGYALLPTRVWTTQRQEVSCYIGECAWNTCWELSAQQVVKFFLTEGDKLAVGLMTTVEEQGEYALAANYGSLLARMLFLPVEDTLRGYFTQIVGRASANDVPSSPNSPESPIAASDSQPTTPAGTPAGTTATTTGTAAAGTTPTGTSESDTDGMVLLSRVLRSYAYLGILSAGFGPLVAGYVLSFVVKTARFGNAAEVLAAYACYVPVLAWNGALDALVQSVAPLGTLRQQGFVLAALALCFPLLTYTFVTLLRMGAAGLVWAQVVGMALRALWALHFATTYFAVPAREWLALCCPSTWVLAVAAAAVAVARLLVGPAHRASQFGIIAVLGLAVAAACLCAERHQIAAVVARLRRRPKKYD